MGVLDQDDIENSIINSSSESAPLMFNQPTSIAPTVQIPIDTSSSSSSSNVASATVTVPTTTTDTSCAKKKSVCLMVSLTILNLILQNGFAFFLSAPSYYRLIFLVPLVFGIIALISRSRVLNIIYFGVSVILFFLCAFWACVITFIISYYSPLKASFLVSIAFIVYLLLSSVCMRYHARYIKHLSAVSSQKKKCNRNTTTTASTTTTSSSPSTFQPLPPFVGFQQANVAAPVMMYNNKGQNPVFYPPPMQPMYSFGGNGNAFPPLPFGANVHSQQQQQQQQPHQQQYYPIPYYYVVPPPPQQQQQQQQQQPPKPSQ